MISRVRQSVIACLAAYVLVLHGVAAAAMSGVHAAEAVDIAAGVICAPSSDGAPPADSGHWDCDCGPMCLQASNVLIAPDLPVSMAGLRPMPRRLAAGADLPPIRSGIKFSPHISRAPPLLTAV